MFSQYYLYFKIEATFIAFDDYFEDAKKFPDLETRRLTHPLLKHNYISPDEYYFSTVLRNRDNKFRINQFVGKEHYMSMSTWKSFGSGIDYSPITFRSHTGTHTEVISMPNKFLCHYK
jgi:hypothetical protein